MDSKLNCIDANKAAEQLTQYSEIELLEKNMVDLYDDKYRDLSTDIFTRITTGDRVTGNVEIKRKDGSSVPIEYRASLITIQEQTYALVVANDLTLRKRYQDRLTALYEIALEMAEANNMDIIADLCLSAINDVLKYNLCTFSLVENNYIRFKYQNLQSDYEKLPLDRTSVTSRTVKTGEIQFIPDVSKDPDFIPCKGYDVKSELAVPVKVNDYVRAVINIESEEINAFTKEDIDHVATLAELVSNAMHRLDTKEYLEKLVEKRTEELRELNNQLIHLGDMKNQFINHITHELRTPLTSIKGYLEILGSTEYEKDSVEHFFTILSRNTDRLVSLTNDLLEQQRIETQNLRLETSPTILSDIIEQSVENITPMMQQKNQTTSIDYDNNTPALAVDPIKIGQVMDNLLSNAVKYSNLDSHIIVRTEKQDKEVIVSIIDEGIGLSSEDLAELFKPFPAIQRPSNNENSTGLGLSICKGIIELHNGRIWASSTGKGKGSTFSFTLPLKKR